MECVVLWHRAIPVLDEQEDPGAHDAWTDDLALRAREGGGPRGPARGLHAGGAVRDARHHVALGVGPRDPAPRRRARPEHGGPARGARGGRGRGGRARGRLVGAAFDRAQLLANRARFGELVLDPACQAIAREAFLFSRTVNTGSAGLRGDAIDRGHAFLADCRARSGTCAARAAAAGGRGVARHRGGGAARRQRAAHAAWSERCGSASPLDQARGGAGPAAGAARGGCPRRARAAGQLAPRAGTPVRLGPRGPRGVQALPKTPAWASHQAPARRGAHPRRRAALLVRAMLDRGHGKRGREVGRLAGPGGRHRPVHAEGPQRGHRRAGRRVRAGGAPARRGARARRHRRERCGGVLAAAPDPALGPALACMVLGEPEGSGLASRVAAIGGDTPLGVIEAARALVAAGDLIHEAGRFRFRLSPPTVDGAVPLERLLADRLRGVDPIAHRVLEMVCLLPQGAGERSPAEPGGRPRRDLAGRGTRALEDAGGAWLLEHRTEWRPSSEELRHVVLGAMPPARRAELYRFVAEACALTGPVPRSRAPRSAFYLAEGGDAEAGAKGLLTAAVAAADSGAPAQRAPPGGGGGPVPARATTRAASPPTCRQTIKRREREANPARASLPGDSAWTPAPPWEPRPWCAPSTPCRRATSSAPSATWSWASRRGAASPRPTACAWRSRCCVAPPARRAEPTPRCRGGAAPTPGERARAALTLALIHLQEGDGKAAVREGLRALQSARAAKDPRGDCRAAHAGHLLPRRGRGEDANALAARAQPMAPPPSTSMV
jgi:hypothetical protein